MFKASGLLFAVRPSLRACACRWRACSPRPARGACLETTGAGLFFWGYGKFPAVAQQPFIVLSSSPKLATDVFLTCFPNLEGSRYSRKFPDKLSSDGVDIKKRIT